MVAELCYEIFMAEESVRKSTIRVRTPDGDTVFDAVTDEQLEELITISLPLHGDISRVPCKILGAIAAELRGRREEARAVNPRIRHEHMMLEIGKKTENESD